VSGSPAATTLRRARRLPVVSPAAFRRLALLALGSLFLIVLTGAAVRLTGSGLGCANWPRCSDSSVLPERDFHALIEFGNRAVSIPVGLLTLATAASAWLATGVPRLIRWSAVAVVLVVAVEAWLGGVTVKSELDAAVVMIHFLLALAAIGLAVVVALGADRLARGVGPEPVSPWAGRLAVALVPVALVLVVTGAFVTAAGPHSGGPGVERLGNLLDAVYIHVRATAVFGVGFVILVALVFRARESARLTTAIAGGVLALLVIQMIVGEAQWRNQLPWWLVLVHVALATAVWAGVVALAALLPLRSAPDPAHSAHHPRVSPN
jgi:heme a synthase